MIVDLPRKPHVMILAGETSGDAHAAELIEQIRRSNADIRFSGMGSQEMTRTGARVFFDSSAIAVMGLVEVLKHWGDIKRAMAIVRKQLDETRPDLLILVDYPEFNLKMAAHAKQLGIKVLFYISPQVWAWRPKRITKIGQLIDHMAVIFKFEVPYYEKAGIPVSFVGHPLVDKVSTSLSKQQAKQELGIKVDETIIGLFPGSRNSEIERLLPLMLESAAELTRINPRLNFVLPVAPSLDFESIKRKCDASSARIQVSRANIYDLIKACDFIVSCSGTVTLEIALLGVPMCIVYKMSPLSYPILRYLVKIPHIGLVNIVAEKSVVREFLQSRANAKNVCAEALKAVTDRTYRQGIEEDLLMVRKNLGEGDNSKKMAELVLSMLSSNHPTTQ